MAATLRIIRKDTDRKLRACAHEADLETITLENGAKIPRVIKTLFDALGDDDILRVAEVYREAMQAERRFWVDQGKDENGRAKGYWKIEPDHKTRIAAANMVAAYKEGLPVGRQMILNGSFEELSEVIAAMRSSGEAKRLLGPAVFEIAPSTSEG